MKKVSKLINEDQLEKLPIHADFWTYIDINQTTPPTFIKSTSTRFNKNISRVIEFKLSKNE